MRQPIEWKEAYSVGSAELDEHHRTLLELVNEINRALDGGTSEPRMYEMIQRACDYAKRHFRREEGLMAQCGFAGLEAHRQAHQTYVAHVEAIRNDAALDAKLMTFKLCAFLEQWWIVHITGTDRDYVPYINQPQMPQPEG